MKKFYGILMLICCLNMTIHALGDREYEYWYSVDSGMKFGKDNTFTITPEKDSVVAINLSKSKKVNGYDFYALWKDTIVLIDENNKTMTFKKLRYVGNWVVVKTSESVIIRWGYEQDADGVSKSSIKKLWLYRDGKQYDEIKSYIISGVNRIIITCVEGGEFELKRQNEKVEKLFDDFPHYEDVYGIDNGESRGGNGPYKILW